jgi:flagella basal body P-ring formation protein FlgA
MWLVSLLAIRLYASECLALRDDTVTAADLASVAPAFGTLPPAARVAFAPAPGVTRWISPGELVRIGRQQGITAEPVGICLSRQVQTLDQERVLTAMRAAGPDYEIELLGFGPREAPSGRLEFSARTLPHVPRQPSVPVVQWRGRLVSDNGRAFPIWTRARITVRRPGLVAGKAIAAGQVIESDALSEVELADYPGWDPPLADAALITGRRARRDIAPNAPIHAPLLALRRDIERGDSVTVQLPGEATLTAQAESPGRTGETILVRNPLTGRRFPSKVTGVGKAIMSPDRSKPPEVATDDHP